MTEIWNPNPWKSEHFGSFQMFWSVFVDVLPLFEVCSEKDWVRRLPEINTDKKGSYLDSSSRYARLAAEKL